MFSCGTERAISSKGRITKKLSSILDGNLLSYAAAAGAAGVSLMALAQPSEAQIIFTPTHQQMGGSFTLKIDLNNDGIADFNIRGLDGGLPIGKGGPYPSGTNATSSLGLSALNGNRFVLNASGWAAPLPFGQKIGPGNGDVFQSVFGSMAAADGFTGNSGSCNPFGAWKGVTNQYLGLEFSIQGELHYGWARLSVNGGCPYFVTLSGYAYEATPRKRIRAGQTSGSLESRGDENPRGATLGQLASGALSRSLGRSRVSR